MFGVNYLSYSNHGLDSILGFIISLSLHFQKSHYYVNRTELPNWLSDLSLSLASIVGCFIYIYLIPDLEYLPPSPIPQPRVSHFFAGAI